MDDLKDMVNYSLSSGIYPASSTQLDGPLDQLANFVAPNSVTDTIYTSHFKSTIPQQHGDVVSESRVLIIMTGGTICMIPSDSGLVPAPDFLKTHLVPRPSFNDATLPAAPDLVSLPPHSHDHDQEIITPSLRTPLSAYNRHVLYTVQEFSPLLDSSSISSPSWQLIAQAIQKNYHLFDGFVVLHGTDSMAYTSSALSFMLTNLSKPVILTGSQKPFSQILNDATDNLLGALILAGHYSIPEVGVFFHHNLYRGNRVTKVSASDFAGFASPNLPPLAEVSAMGTQIRWDLVLSPPSDNPAQPLQVHPSLDTAHCACLRMFPGITALMLDAVIRVKPIIGLVLETFGAGNAPGDDDVVQVLAEAIKRDVVIVNITQCLRGSVSPVYAAGRRLTDIGVVAGRDMTSEAALTKLAWCLARGWSADEVRGEMARDMRGEMSSV